MNVKLDHLVEHLWRQVSAADCAFNATVDLEHPASIRWTVPLATPVNT
jgi:hypothetical protein